MAGGTKKPDDKIIEVTHKEIEINGKTEGWIEVNISTPVLVGFIIFVVALLFFIFH
jgi:hypothetical protein